MDNVIKFPSMEDHDNEYVINEKHDKNINELREMMKNNTMVSDNIFGAKLISEILMNDDPNIKYCEHIQCVSRKGQFIKVVPVYNSDLEHDNILFIKDSIIEDYIHKLIIDGRLITNDDGVFIFKD